MVKDAKVYGEIHKSSQSKIIIQKSKYKGKNSLDLRLWISDDTKNWIPTKSGISIAWDDVQELKEIVKKIKDT